MNNYDALGSFVERNVLERDHLGRCWFKADVVIRAGGRGGAEMMPARISFASGDTDQLVLDGGSILVPGEMPLSYRTEYGDWSAVNDMLIIVGNYRGLFDYRTEISVAE